MTNSVDNLLLSVYIYRYCNMFGVGGVCNCNMFGVGGGVCTCGGDIRCI